MQPAKGFDSTAGSGKIRYSEIHIAVDLSEFPNWKIISRSAYYRL
jgi:hypothetical protein